MSGFAGIVSVDGAPPDERLLEAIAHRLEFRGPHGTHIRSLPGMGACFTFLSTGPAPQSEKQPFSLDGTIWLLGDVRLDGTEELREALRKLGENIPEDASCEELALHAWKQWRKESFARLEGDYAFAIWDAEARKLYGVRDFIGARPFFYAQAGNRLYFSNTLDAIRLAPDISAENDPHFIGDFLLQAWCADAERTAFRDIRRLPPGRMLEFTAGEIIIRQFSTLPIEEPLFRKHPQEYVEEFRARLRAAVLDRLPRDRAVIFLSGGMDSTSVGAQAAQLAREVSKTKLLALTVDARLLFKDEEGVLASRVAEYCGIPFEIISMANTIPYGNLASAEFQLPEPSAEPFHALNVELYRRCASHGQVVLNGEGGDVVLNGQARTYLGYLLRRGRLIKLGSELGSYMLRHRRLPFLRTGLRARLRRRMGKKEPTLTFPEWINPEFAKEMHLKERWVELNRPRESSQHPIHPEAYASLTSTYWGLLLEDEDAAWSGEPVETRSPFLDARLLRFLLRVPPLPWCMQKELLREATRGILPEEIRLRPKVPLQEDPLPLLMERGPSIQTPLGELGANSGRYVNWLKFPATSATDEGYVLTEKMRAIVLDNWLKGVEKMRGIQ